MYFHFIVSCHFCASLPFSVSYFAVLNSDVLTPAFIDVTEANESTFFNIGIGQYIGQC